jgi:hypothetical protein
MAKAIRSADIASKNWVEAAGAKASFYGSQVQGAAWQTYAGSDKAESNYALGVQAAITAKSRAAAINKSGDAAWKGGVSSVGVSRYGAGVAASKPKMDAAMGKLIPAIDAARKALGPRGLRGSPENLKRGTDFQTALTKQRGNFKARGVARSG